MDNLTITITAKDGASTVFRAVSGSAREMRTEVEKVGQSGKGFSGLVEQIEGLDAEFNRAGAAATAFGATVTGVAAIGANRFINLEASMANVQSIAQVSEGALAGLTDQVRGLAVELGTKPTGLAEGLYDITSSGFEANDALTILRASAISAKAGLTDTGTAARATTAILNAYKLSADQAGDVTDILFQTVNSGVITFEQLANNLSQTLPLAANLNVELTELAAAYTELTLQAFNASQAETGIANILRAAINPTEDLTEAVREYGYASAEALIQAEGLAGFLRFLEQETGGSTAALQDLLGTAEGTTAAVALLSSGVDGFTDRVGEMEGAAQDGATTLRTYETQAATTAAAIDRAKAAIRDLGITIGGAIAPGINAAADAISHLALAVSVIPDSLQNVAAWAGTAAGALSLLAGGLLLVVPRVAETVQAFIALKNAMVAANAVSLVGTFGAVGLALGAVTVAGGYLLSSWLEQKQAAAEYNTTLTTLDQTLEAIRQQGDAVIAARGRGVEQLILDLQEASTAADNFARFTQDILGETPANPQFDSANFARQQEAWQAYQAALGDARIDAELTVDAIDALNSALNNPNVDVSAYLEWANGLLTAADGTDTLTDDVAALNAIIATQNEMPTEFLTAYADEADRAAESTSKAQSAMDAMLGSLAEMPGSYHDAAQAAADAREELQQLREEWIQSALAAGGFDDALSQLHLAGAASDVSRFAEEWRNANAALDSTFRVIVGTTNGIIQQVDGIQSWADSLINVRGELGAIDDLLAGGFIDIGIYTDAQQAYDDISVSVGNIRNNLLAVQAIQAPFIAEAIAGTERWAAELREMPADIQRTTLAFMDLQTVQTAQELVSLANASAFATMGDEGRTAFEAMIQGAAQTNPMLLDVLETMGYITRAGDDFTINWDAIAAGGDAITQLTTSVQGLVDTLREVYGLPPLTIEVDSSGIDAAETQVRNLLGIATGLDGWHAQLAIDADTEQAVADVDGIATTLAAIDGTTASVSVAVNVAGGGGAAGGALASAADLLASLDIPESVETTVTATVEGGAELQAVRDQVTEIDGLTATVQVDVTADDSAAREVAAYWTGYQGVRFATIEVGITGNAGGPDGVLTVLDNLTLGGKESRDIAIDITATDNATAVIDTVALNMAQINGATPGITVVGTDDASDEIATVASALAGINGDVATVTITAVDNASSVIGGISGALGALNGRTATSYVDTVYRTIGSPSMLGGIPEHAMGGVVFRGGEAGPELAHFAGGGTALLPRDGTYMVPPMTYISPAPASQGQGGGGAVYGDTYELHIHGNVYGIDDLADALEGAIQQRRRGYGAVRR